MASQGYWYKHTQRCKEYLRLNYINIIVFFENIDKVIAHFIEIIHHVVVEQVEYEAAGHENYNIDFPDCIWILVVLVHDWNVNVEVLN